MSKLTDSRLRGIVAAGSRTMRSPSRSSLGGASSYDAVSTRTSWPRAAYPLASASDRWALPPTRGGKKLLTTAMRIARPRAGRRRPVVPRRAGGHGSSRDQVGHALPDLDGRLEAEHLAGPAGVGGPAADQHVAAGELRLHVGADGRR